VAIHRIEIALLRYPHTRESGEVINLGDIAERLVHVARIKD
jgi:hypothetical protein